MIRQEEVQAFVLRALGEKKMHGYEIHKVFEDRGISIRIGRLYDILNHMSSKGLLEDEWISSESGPKKRVYHLSPSGTEARDAILMDAIRTVHEFYGEYLRGLPPEKSAFTTIANTIVSGLSTKPAIAYVANVATRSIKQLFQAISEIKPLANIYFVGPRDTFSEMELESIPSLEGNPSNIPSKDGFFDLIVLPSYSTGDDVHEHINEWLRVLTPTGKVAMVTPTALIKEIHDPMSIGEFIEMREHPRGPTKGVAPESLIISELEQEFLTVRSESVVHISIISAHARKK